MCNLERFSQIQSHMMHINMHVLASVYMHGYIRTYNYAYILGIRKHADGCLASMNSVSVYGDIRV